MFYQQRLRPERGAQSPSECERGWGPASFEKCKTAMNLESVLGILVTVALLIYLVVAMMRPEKF
jgi:K+-transporting ATPase KdpF subunit